LTLLTGKRFEVKYTPVEEIRTSIDPNATDPIQNLMKEYSIVLGEGKRFGNFDTNLNRLCSNVKPVRVKAFLEKWWPHKLA
jgi:hypothetical protein